MTAEQTHIKLEFNWNATCDTVQWFALDQELLRKAQIWQAGQGNTPSAAALSGWLQANGGLVDCGDGPAVIQTWADGSRYEAWLSMGARDRADGPAIIATYADGSRREAWYSKGELYRDGGPAHIETRADGYRREAWFSKDLLDRADGPAIIITGADGCRRESWFSKGELIKKETLACLSVIPGVTLYRPAASST
jgi:hypothetical protein